MNTKINVIRLQKNTFLLICREITTYVCEERIETNCCITTGVGFFFPSHLPVNGFTATPLPHNNSFIEVYNAYFILYNRIPPLFKARLLRGRTIICISPLLFVTIILWRTIRGNTPQYLIKRYQLINLLYILLVSETLRPISKIKSGNEQTQLCFLRPNMRVS